MITESELRELLDYDPQHYVLSVYLDTDLSQNSAETHKARLRAMLKDVELREDVSAVEKYFSDEYDWSGNSGAVFSCAGEGFFRAYPLAVPMRERMRVSGRPYVKPLAYLLDAYGGYGVVLVDKQDARFFNFHMGALREEEGLRGEGVRRAKSGGGSQSAGRRSGTVGGAKRTGEIAERNMRAAAEAAANFFAKNKVRRVLIGGTEANVGFFRQQLPKAWQSLVTGVFPIAMNASHQDVQARALKIGAEAERRREERLMDAVITAAAKGQGGVVRLGDTLSAVHEGRVTTLLIQDGFRSPGYRCEGCGYLTVQKMEACLFCGESFEKIPDAVEMAVRKVMQEGGEVEVLFNNEELERSGNIGALLRY